MIEGRVMEHTYDPSEKYEIKVSYFGCLNILHNGIVCCQAFLEAGWMGQDSWGRDPTNDESQLLYDTAKLWWNSSFKDTMTLRQFLIKTLRKIDA